MEKPELVINDCNTCLHSDNTYSIAINIENTMIGFSSSHYNHCPGNYNTISIFNMKPSDMFELAEKISNTANKIIENEVNEAGSIPNVPETRKELNLPELKV
jgi:hypothetical protein